MKEIPMTRGEVCTVDDEDFDIYGAHRWYVSAQGYARRDVGGRSNRKAVLMHRLIANPPDCWQVHHLDLNRLNNCRANLDVLPHSDHVKYHAIRKGPKTGIFKGVHWDVRKDHWIATLQVNKVIRYLGAYLTAEDAARAYDAAAYAALGEQAFLNLPDRLHEPAPPRLLPGVWRNRTKPPYRLPNGNYGRDPD